MTAAAAGRQPFADATATAGTDRRGGRAHRPGDHAVDGRSGHARADDAAVDAALDRDEYHLLPVCDRALHERVIVGRGDFVFDAYAAPESERRRHQRRRRQRERSRTRALHRPFSLPLPAAGGTVAAPAGPLPDGGALVALGEPESVWLGCSACPGLPAAAAARAVESYAAFHWRHMRAEEGSARSR